MCAPAVRPRQPPLSKAAKVGEFAAKEKAQRRDAHRRVFSNEKPPSSRVSRRLARLPSIVVERVVTGFIAEWRGGEVGRAKDGSAHALDVAACPGPQRPEPSVAAGF